MSEQTPALILFLRARLDEDESVARAVTDFFYSEGRWSWQYHPTRGSYLRDVREGTRDVEMLASKDKDGPTYMVAAHIARHDPARVLAEVLAKRSMIQSVEAMADRLGVYVEQTQGWGLLVAMAAVWARHTDWRSNWYEHAGEWK